MLINYFAAFTIDPSTGALAGFPVSAGPVMGSDGLVAVHAQFLYACGRGGSAIIGAPPGPHIAVYSLNQTTATPTLLPGELFSLGADAYPRGLATVPNSYFLYAADSTDSGGGKMDAFVVDSTTGVVVTPIAGSPLTSGSNKQLVADPSGKFLYASDDDPPGGILAFTIAPTGALTPVPGSPFTIPGQTVANSQPLGIVDTGKFVYAALSGASPIAAFSIDSETGALSSVPGSPFASGNSPGVLALANNFLCVANGQDGSISGYSIDSDTAVLTPLAGFPFGTSSATLVADSSGRYLNVSQLARPQGYNIDARMGALTEGGGGHFGDRWSLWMTVVQFPASTAQQALGPTWGVPRRSGHTLRA